MSFLGVLLEVFQQSFELEYVRIALEVQEAQVDREEAVRQREDRPRFLVGNFLRKTRLHHRVVHAFAALDHQELEDLDAESVPLVLVFDFGHAPQEELETRQCVLIQIEM